MSDIVFTLTGPDRVGIVEEVTRGLLELGGNVAEGRMVRLGGEFAMLMLVTSPATPSAVEAAFAPLAEQGYAVGVTATRRALADTHPGWLPFRIEVQGADHEGIVHEIAAGLSHRGINIEQAETATTAAPVSGTPLFSMSAVVAVPPDLPAEEWQAELRAAGRAADVEVTITPTETA